MTLFVSEILQLVAEAVSRKEKIEILRNHDTIALRTVLWNAFNTELEFVNVPRKLEYKPDDAPMGLNPASLYKTHKQFYIFRTDKTDITEERRIRTLIQLLEGMHEDESALYLRVVRQEFGVKDRSPYRGLTAKLVQTAFPGLLPEKEKKEESNGIEESVTEAV